MVCHSHMLDWLPMHAQPCLNAQQRDPTKRIKSVPGKVKVDQHELPPREQTMADEMRKVDGRRIKTRKYPGSSVQACAKLLAGPTADDACKLQERDALPKARSSS